MTEVTAGSRHRRALVTGASSGIGAAIASELAGRGYDLILLARDAERLAAAAEELRTTHDVDVDGRCMDLSQPESVATLATELAQGDPPVEILVNNAGVGIHGPFAETSLDEEWQLVELQLRTLLALTKAVLPAMLERGVGRILNVGSVYSFFPVAGQSVYGACKAFMGSYSEALATELSGTGVTVTLLCPGTTNSRFRMREAEGDPANTGGSSGGMDPGRVAAAGCRGLFAGRRIVVPGTLNRTYVFGSRVLPRRWFSSLLGRVNARRGVGVRP